MNRTGKIISEHVVEDHVTGEITRHDMVVQFPAEPEFVKLYLDCLGVYIKNKGLSESFNDLLIEVLKRCNYAEDGQIVHLDAFEKEAICKKTGKSLNRLKQAINIWVKNNILIRCRRGVFQVNPYIIGRGTWKSISELRASIDFKNGTITTEKEYSTAKQKKAIRSEEKSHE